MYILTIAAQNNKILIYPLQIISVDFCAMLFPVLVGLI